MKLSSRCKLLMKFFSKENIDFQEQTNKTREIFIELYNDIYNSYEYLLELKKPLYHISIKNIQSISQIVKPKQFNSKSFPIDVRKHIDENTFSEITYSFSLFDKNIKLIFVLEEANVEDKIKIYNKYVDLIIMWMYILNEYASKFCAKTLTVYLYFTSLEKKLPESDFFVIDEIHVNTAFTRTCPRDAEIVIYRKEEWFKVFMHETFHTFGLDFSDMNNNDCTSKILSIFPVNSEVNLYESYAEFWAEIMNALFCSFLNLKNKRDIDLFLRQIDLFIHHERSNSFLQLVKILNFMGLKYSDMYKKNSASKILRDTLYKEKTNVLSYFVIKTILLNQYQGFLMWCKNNNNTLLHFRKSPANVVQFCKFIEKNYKISSMIRNVERTEELKSDNNFIKTNLRMSVCEMV